MKKTELGLSFLPDSQNQTGDRGGGTGRLLIALSLTIGLWGMGQALLPLSVLVCALAVLLPAMLLRGGKKESLLVLLAGGVLALALGLVFHTQITSGIGAMVNTAAEILTRKTGTYFRSVQTDGQTLAAGVAVGVLLALVVTWMVRTPNPIVMLLCSAGVFYAWGLDLLQGEGFLALYLLGMTLVLAQCASTNAKSVLWTAGLTICVLGLAALCCGLASYEPDSSQALAQKVHHWRYEQGSEVLPEGKLADLGAKETSEEPALEITMEEWKGVYLRGFVGSQYTGSGWEAEDCGVLADHAQLLYSLQKDYFHPFAQLSAAQTALEAEPENAITVKNAGACKAYAYLPYGVGAVELDSRKMTQPELSAFTGTLTQVEDAYLVQKELSDGAGDASYRNAEGAYRQWVYSQYLTLPQDVSTLLSQSLGKQETMTSTELKERVLTWLHATLTYDEYAQTRAGSTDLAEYLVNVSPYGYSVHYATLATLAMRSLGVPARYVEGYIVPKTLASTLEAGQTLVLSKEYAHAWVEYYLDGVGWVPFEVTPKYEGELIYQLPPDGTGLQNPPVQNPPEENEPEEPPVKQDPNAGNEARVHAVRLARNILLLVLLAALLAFVVRTILLRKKLRQRWQRFREEESREAMLECLAYQFQLLELMGIEKRNVPLSQREGEISKLLFGDDVKPMLLRAQELCFSNHPVTQEQHTRILGDLDRILEVWKQTTPKRQRFCQKWIRCQVL